MKEAKYRQVKITLTKFAGTITIAYTMAISPEEYNEATRATDLQEAKQLTAELNVLIEQLRQCNGTCVEFAKLYAESITKSDRIEEITSKYC